MALPTLTTPKYTLTLPSNGKVVEYRPFLVKEEKILLIAQESEDQNQVLSAIKDIVHSCTFGKINADSLPSFDLEYIFLKLRAKSVGESSSVGLECQNCKTVNDVKIDIDSVKVDKKENVNPKIQLTDEIGVSMKYLTVKDISAISAKNNTEVDNMTDTIIACIDFIYDATNIYPRENCSYEEMTSFIDSLNHTQLLKIQEYITAIPKLSHDVSFCCSHCKTENKVTLSGVQSFFE